MTIKVYLGGPLFNEMEQSYNAGLAKSIRDKYGDKVELYNPMENEALNDKSGYANSLMIYSGDNDYLKETDVLIAIMDGQTPDVGLASEIGYYASLAENMKDDKKRVILGLYSDIRQGYVTPDKVNALDNELAESAFSYVNLYTNGAIKSNGFLFDNSQDLIDAIGEYITD